ncbi:MAG: hypothetical protein GF308_00950 [Candidatus Heimdallarchaeota archaeon]|nr:hypothetical protein [Candidatus Heimdallarchaeota archaeon]
MLNHRLLSAPKEPKKFVPTAVEFIQKHAKNKKVFCALSGGIDSSATYLLLKKAGVNVLPVFIDHGLMRIIRGREEREYVKELFPDVKVVDIRKEFLPKIFGEGDAEIKRKLFKKAYSETFDKIIDEENCDLLADGTILPDLEESFGVEITDLKETMSTEEEIDLRKAQKGRGFVKSQHNVEIEYAVEATLQPVASLTKDEVRQLLKFLDMPDELVYRKAFPGPALAARIVGAVNEDNLGLEKEVHDIVESQVNDFYTKKHGKSMIINEKGAQEPFQVFAAVLQDVDKAKVTGILDGNRTYRGIKVIKDDWDYQQLTALGKQVKDYSRVFYLLEKSNDGTYDVVIRSVNSIDARTATVTNLPIDLLKEITEKIITKPEVKNVYFDVTPKPPGTIEYV